MPVLKNVRALYTGVNGKPQGFILEISRAAVVWRGAKIEWVGAESAVPALYNSEQVFDGQGLVAVPGLIDCHTHLAFAGWRTEEFKRKILGESYLDIAKSGGGIISTVSKTRAASKTELVERAGGFLAQIAKLGVTTLEAKSGYGLTLEDELKLLEVYRELASVQPIQIISTFLGAHTNAPEFKNSRDDYVKLVIEKMLPAAASKKLAQFCDVFVEDSAFTTAEARRILEAAKQLGMKLKLHVEQINNLGGAELASELGATSADHLEQISDAGIAALAKSGTVAVALPIASLYIKQPALDARKLISAGIPVAVATDFNPGSAPTFDLHLAMMLGCTLCRMTPTEVLNAATLMAAKALDLDTEIGSLEAGKNADFALLDIESIDQWMYHFTGNVCRKSFKNGMEIHG